MAITEGDELAHGYSNNEIRKNNFSLNYSFNKLNTPPYAKHYCTQWEHKAMNKTEEKFSAANMTAKTQIR